MIIRQLTAFVENRKGKFAEIAKLMGDNNVNMLSFTVSENEDFGLVRILVGPQDVDRTYKLLTDNNYAVSLNNVVYFKCPNSPGALAGVMERLYEAGAFVDYMYAHSDLGGDVSRVVIRAEEEELAERIVSEIFK